MGWLCLLPCTTPLPSLISSLRGCCLYKFPNSPLPSLLALSYHTLTGGTAWSISSPNAFLSPFIPFEQLDPSSFLSKGIDFHISFQKSPLATLLALSSHALKGLKGGSLLYEQKTSTLLGAFLKGLISRYLFQKVSSIIHYGSFLPYFWGRPMFHFGFP